MSKSKISFCAVILVMLAVLSCGAFQVSAVAASAKSEQGTSVKNGWKKEKAGYRYYVKGKYLKNQWKKIGGKKYYLGTDGTRKTGWYTIKNKSYYFDTKGVLKKTKAIDRKLVNSMDKVIKGEKIKETTADPEALEKLFLYVKNNCNYSRVMGFKGEKGWEYKFAKQMLSQKKGSCYHYAAAYAFLAKRATGLPVRICWGTSNAFAETTWQPHAWVEIRIGKTWYTYDVNADKFSSLRNGAWYQQKRSSMEGKVYKTLRSVNVEL